ncbi:hypothetical protein FRB99_008704 [Tulasnella sp. 403]|nr:hypothetical protein FRB99_008704 [Tulasnella sp. 403]
MVRFSFPHVVLTTVLFTAVMAAAIVPPRVRPGNSDFALVKHREQAGTRTLLPGERMTNAKRFAAGLPPLPPKPTRTRKVLRQAGSPVVSIVSTGILFVRSSTTSEALFSAPAALFETGLLHTHVWFASDGTYYAGTAPANADTLQPGSPNFVTARDNPFISTQQTPDPNFSSDHSIVGETAVWDFTPDPLLPLFGTLTFTWTNPDNTPVACLLYWDTSTHELIAQPDTSSSSSLEAVSVTIEPRILLCFASVLADEELFTIVASSFAVTYITADEGSQRERVTVLMNEEPSDESPANLSPG